MPRAYMASLSEPTKERIWVSEVIPPKEKVSRTSVKLPDWMWEKLADIAATMSSESKRDGRDPFSRDDIIFHFCRWGMQELEAEREKKKKK